MKNLLKWNHARLSFLLMLVWLVVGGSALAQDNLAPEGRGAEGSGVITLANESSALGLLPLDVLGCVTVACGQLGEFLYPTLLAVDAATGEFVPAYGSHGLAESWTFSEDGRVGIFRLREDRYWSDGTPITAYDVFLRVLLDLENRRDQTRQVIGAAPLDTYTIALLYDALGCSALDYSNRLIVPAHRYNASFAETAVRFFQTDATDADSLMAESNRWREAFREEAEDDYGYRPENFPIDLLNTTAGRFELDSFRPGESVRLVTTRAEDPTETLSLVLLDVNPVDTVQQFLTGRLTYLQNPPYNRYDDIRAVRNVQTAVLPGNAWDYIGFNLADPRRPRGLFDENGAPLDQGQHPIFGDVRVRRAMRLGVDLSMLIDTVVQGEGFPLSDMAHPDSWAYDPQAPMPEYDPVQARRILEDAGWRDSNNDGVRECRGCLYADEGDDLRFTMLYDAGNVRHEIAASLLQRMFFSVGAGVTFSAGSLQERYNQTFDAYMTTRVERFPVNPDLTPLFSTEEDQPTTGYNAGSYSNPEVDALLEQARNVPGCDREARREIYQQIHAILREDVPAFPLYVLPVMVAAQGEVIGFNPLPGAPLWNIETWSIQRRE